MKKIDLDEHKKIQLEIMKIFADFCDKNGLRYYLAYGSLIGAIRHKGFIPWDDDIDIQMPRNDYNSLIAEFNNKCTVDYIRAVCPYDANSKHPIVKIQDTRTVKIEKGTWYDKDSYLGVAIDIFPLDGQPESNDEFKAWYAELMHIYRNYNYQNMSLLGGSWKRTLGLPVMKLIGGSKKCNLDKAATLHSRFKYEDCTFVGTTEDSVSTIADRHPKECFETAIKVPFEDSEFYAPVGYDIVLRDIYGDYMKLPPENQRVGHPIEKLYWKDEFSTEDI